MVFGIIIFVIIAVCAAGFYLEHRHTERMWRELDESRKRSREKFNEQLKAVGRLRERREREEAARRRVPAPQARSESRRQDKAADDDVYEPALAGSTPSVDYWFPTPTASSDDTPTRTTYSSGGGGDFSGGGASGGWSSSDSPSSSYDSSSSSSSSDSGGGGGGGSD